MLSPRRRLLERTRASLSSTGRRILGFAILGAAATCDREPTRPVPPPATASPPAAVTASSAGPVTHLLLTAGTSPANQKVYTTAAITPAPNALVMVAVLGHRSSTASPSPVLSGGGVTAWDVVASVTFSSVGAPHKRLTIFRAMSATPDSGPLTITFPASQSNCQWIVSQWSGVEASGVNGAGAIVQTGAASGDAVSGLAIQLAPFGNAGNVAYGVFGVAQRAVTISPGAGFTEIAEQPSGENPPSDLEAEWATNDTTIDATWTALNGGALGVEIKAAGPQAPVAAVLVTPATASIAAGATVQLTATPVDTSGTPLPGRTISWETGDVSVAGVSASGLVTGGAVGSTTITATSEGKSGSAAITVTAPAGTGSCLSRTGPIVTISGVQSSAYFNAGLADSTRIDASTAQFVGAGTQPVVLGGGSNVCYHGGEIIGALPPSTDWSTMHDTYAFRVRGMPGFVLEQAREFDYGDGISLEDSSADWAIRHAHFKYMRDDCIQDDWLHSGTVDSSLFEGCYSGMSARPFDTTAQDGSNNLVVVRNSLIWLQDMDQGYDGPGHGGFFKWSATGPRLALYNNVYRVDGPSSLGTHTLAPPAGKLSDCANNVMIWLGAGPFPETLPSCYTLLTGAAGLDYWNNAVAGWKASHPHGLTDVGPPIVSLYSPAAATTVRQVVELTATAVDDRAVAGVQFQMDGQSIGPEVTAESPLSKFTLSWDTRGLPDGTHTLTASARDTSGNITTSGGIPVTISNTVSPSRSTVAASPSSLTAGTGVATITVVVMDTLGNPVSGATVTLSATGSGNTITQPAVPTGADGVATGSFGSTGAESKTITAVANGLALDQQPAVVVAAGPADPGASAVSATPTSIMAGGAGATITVTVRDQYANPVSQANVVLSVTPATGATLTGGGLTNASGIATGTLSSTVAEVKTVSATADGVAISQTVAVTVTTPAPGPVATLVGAGDIADCASTGDDSTAVLLDTIPGTVFTTGDNAYPSGSATDFTQCYDPSWGRHKGRTRPTPGNHDYDTPGAAGYFGYFGAQAGDGGTGFYSYDIGSWHVIALNSNISMSAGSPQEQWLRADLAASTKQCTIAMWHHPRFSSGTHHGSTVAAQPLWQALYDAGAEIVISSHEHNYERFAPQTPTGLADPFAGIREFVVGTGGESHYDDMAAPLANSEVFNGTTWGVLRLMLDSASYSWRFIPVTGQTFTDSGSTACHGPSSDSPISATGSTITAAPLSFTAGSGSSTISVTARDKNGNTVSGAAVSLSVSGSGNTLTPSSGITDGNGVFTSMLTSTVAELKTVSATIEQTVIMQTALVSVTSTGGGGGPITLAVLALGGDPTNQKIFTTAPIAPTAGALVTVAVRMRRSSGPQTPTLSGGGMASWTLVASVDYGTVTTPDSRLMVFRAMSAAPGSGAITITFPSSVSNVEWLALQWTGVDQSGTNGSGAIGQIGSTASDATTSLSKALAPFASASNVALGIVGAKTGPPAVTPGSGFTEIAEPTSGEGTLLEAEWGVNLNTVSATLSKSVAAGLLAIEITASSSGPMVSASQSTVAVSPASITAGGSGSTITVTAKDGSGNPISGATVVLAATGSGNTLTQPVGTTGPDGSITGTLGSTVAQDKVVSATINGVAITQQATVTVTPAAAAALAFTTQPGNTQANAPITPAVTVEVRDQFGNRVSSTPSVAMAIGTNPGSGTLAGTTSQQAVAGVASFADLSIDQTGTGYTLLASSAGLASATSDFFNITAPAPSASLSTAIAGTPSFLAGGSSAITVTVKDGLGNPLSGVTVTLSSSVGGDVVTQPAATTDGGGVTAGGVSATSAGPRTITAVAGGVTLTQQPSLTVSAGPPDAGTSSVSANPTTITAGSGSATITVTVRDQYGNPVSGAGVTLATSGTNFTLTQPGATGSTGVATGSLSSTDPQSFTVSATAGGVAITQTAAVTVTSQPPPGITHALLTSGHDANNLRLYTTGSIAPAANALVTVAVLTHQSSSAAPSPTLTGGGMTSWEVVATVAYNGATPLDRLTIYRAMSPSPGSGPITITSSSTVSNCQWIVSQWSGVDQSGTNGAGAIAQTAAASGTAVTNLTAALASFGNGSNVAYGAFGAASATAVISPGAGFTTIDQQPSGEGTVGDLFAEWALNLPGVTATWPSKNAGALGVEIKAQVGP